MEIAQPVAPASTSLQPAPQHSTRSGLPHCLHPRPTPYATLSPPQSHTIHFFFSSIFNTK
ncbi:hypothetical protein E2C01_090414 [Portunus trituberculatus]|uniref:Uncharacterized protein n=1 Tax=Portunus trituberculatus TaxID=210409 RepID=A0A5B7JLB4_PORTR|nr:hypothetical protein [Portunus trituberculatus]